MATLDLAGIITRVCTKLKDKFAPIDVVYDWAKAATKPTYTASEVGALPDTTLYAGAETAGGPAIVTNGIHYAHVDSTSTSTVFTATVSGITELYDGLTILLKNGVVTSASGFTININGLGAKPVYNSMAAEGRETTIFNVNYTLLLIYDSTRVDGGCWINYRGYYSDANTVPTGYCTTAAATVAKAATCTHGYRDDDTYFPCLFRYANTAANATLAIASYATAAAPIYVNGARTSSSNTFGRGVILFLYHNGAYYCYNDGRFPIVVDGAVTSVQEYIASKQDKLVSGTNIKTINGNSLLGPGDITVSGGSSLPSVTTADNDKVLMVVDGAWAAGELPVYNGEIVTPAYNVTISLTNPVNSGSFNYAWVYTWDGPGTHEGNELGRFQSPVGTISVSVDGVYGIAFYVDGTSPSMDSSMATCSGGVSFTGYTIDAGLGFQVTGDGTIVIDGIDYND